MDMFWCCECSRITNKNHRCEQWSNVIRIPERAVNTIETLAIENHEASICPEGFGCKDYIAALRDERDRLRGALVAIERQWSFERATETDSEYKKGVLLGKEACAIIARAALEGE